MKIFSKLMLFAAAALAFGATACSDDDDVAPAVPDAVSVTPDHATVGSKGGETKVVVTSSSEWTLTGAQNDYVTVSADKGNDGAEVTFTVKANDKHEDRIFNYEFVCGEKKAAFVLTLTRKAADELTLNFTEGANNIEAKGGEVTVNVVSSDAWKLEGGADFVTASAVEGKDGDNVKFTVAENTATEERTADYTFVCGEKKVAFQIKQAAFSEQLEITSGKEMRIASVAEKKIKVMLTTDVNPRDLSAEVTTADGESWITYRASMADGESVAAYFEVAANRGEAAREADITIKTRKGTSASMKMIQLPAAVLSVEKLSYFVSVEAQTFSVPYTANVEFDVKVTDGDGWLTLQNKEGGQLNFAVEALTGEARTCTVMLTEQNPPVNAEAATTSFTISQKPQGLISHVADMRQSRTFFKTVENGDPLRMFFNGLTFEALVNIQEERMPGMISTIMGVENHFLLRMGDNGLPFNQLQLATMNGKVTSPQMRLPELNRWYHIAVTYEAERLKVYIDGKLVYDDAAQFWGMDFARPFTGTENDKSRAFWIGYSYNSDRCFPGYMSEVRIWKRALTAEEINAENHFYQVDPKSDKLSGYWKLDGTEGSLVKDYSPSGNDMVGEINVHHNTSDNTHIGEEGMNWIEMNLP